MSTTVLAEGPAAAGAASHGASSTISTTALSAPEGALRLADWGVIRARGDDAASFLQGQLTNDVPAAGAPEARLAGYCSAKGRLQATFVVWRDADGDIFLACSADLLPATLKRLSMFVLRAKCKLSDASAEVPLWGLAGAATVAAAEGDATAAPWALRQRADGAAVIRLPDGMASISAAGAAGQPVPRALLAGAASAPADAPALAPAAWRWLEATSGTARIVAATVEQFVPQMVNFEVVGGVSFKKGCYPGQEVVARSQYRGTLKRRAFVATSDAQLEPAPGQEVFHSEDPAQPAGMVVLAGTHAGRAAALVELKLAAVEGGTLHLGSAGGPSLVLGALPYGLPQGEGG